MAAAASAVDSLGIQVDIGVTSLDRLARLRDSIFAREIAANGKLLWGDPKQIDLPTAIDTHDLRKDGLRLLNNRIIEQLETRVKYEQGEASALMTRFAIQKLWLDLGTSLSIFTQCYQPSYAGRLKALEARRSALDNELGPLAEVLLGHLREATGARFEAAPPYFNLDTEFKCSWHALAQLWIWEGNVLTGETVSLDDWSDIPKCLRRASSFHSCVRDYYRTIKRTQLRESLSWLSIRPILMSGCPGNAIYAAGCLLLFFWEAIEARTRAGLCAMDFANRLLRANSGSSDIRNTALRVCGAWKLHLRAA